MTTPGAIDPGRIRALLDALADPRTRAAAARQLGGVGPAAVDPLVALLEAPEEGRRWAALRALGEVGDPRAIPALEARAAALDFRETALDAIDRIRRRAPRPRGVPAPRRPDSFEPGPDDPAFPAALAGRVAEALHAEIRGQDPRFELSLPLDAGRRRRVWIAFDRPAAGGQPAVSVLAFLGPAAPPAYEAALRLNATLPFCAIAIVERDGVPTFAVVHQCPRTALTVETLVRAAFLAARAAETAETAVPPR
jgi:hypothetical protein